MAISRLIDATRLEEYTDDRYTLGEIWRRERDDIVVALVDAPTVDAIPVEWLEQFDKYYDSGIGRAVTVKQALHDWQSSREHIEYEVIIPNRKENPPF